MELAENPRNLCPELREVDDRLRELYAWAKDHGINLGYPSENIIYRIIRQGAGAIQLGHPPVTMPDEVAQIDRAIAHLRRIVPAKAKTLEINYRYLHEPQEVRARRAHLKRTSFVVAVRDAQWILYGLLHGT